MFHFDKNYVRTPVLHRKDSPFLPLPKQRAHGHRQKVFGLPNRNMDDRPIGVPQPVPRFGRIDKIDVGVDLLLLDAKRGNLDEPGGSTRVTCPRSVAGEDAVGANRSQPAVDILSEDRETDR